jgi:transposase
MISNKKLARAVSDQGFGTARRMLAYKTRRNGGTLVAADRWYPSSKTCSSCGLVKAKLTLNDRIFECEACGHVEDRDVNAARNRRPARDGCGMSATQHSTATVSVLPNPLRSAVSVTVCPASSRSLAVSNLMSSTYRAGVVCNSPRNSRVR